MLEQHPGQTGVLRRAVGVGQRQRALLTGSLQAVPTVGSPDRVPVAAILGVQLHQAGELVGRKCPGQGCAAVGKTHHAQVELSIVDGDQPPAQDRLDLKPHAAPVRGAGDHAGRDAVHPRGVRRDRPCRTYQGFEERLPLEIQHGDLDDLRLRTQSGGLGVKIYRSGLQDAQGLSMCTAASGIHAVVIHPCEDTRNGSSWPACGRRSGWSAPLGMLHCADTRAGRDPRG